MLLSVLTVFARQSGHVVHKTDSNTNGKSNFLWNLTTIDVQQVQYQQQRPSGPIVQYFSKQLLPKNNK